jgi:hypothetical protein
MLKISWSPTGTNRLNSHFLRPFSYSLPRCLCWQYSQSALVDKLGVSPSRYYHSMVHITITLGWTRGPTVLRRHFHPIINNLQSTKVCNWISHKGELFYDVNTSNFKYFHYQSSLSIQPQHFTTFAIQLQIESQASRYFIYFQFHYCTHMGFSSCSLFVCFVRHMCMSALFYGYVCWKIITA